MTFTNREQHMVEGLAILINSMLDTKACDPVIPKELVRDLTSERRSVRLLGFAFSNRELVVATDTLVPSMFVLATPCVLRQYFFQLVQALSKIYCVDIPVVSSASSIKQTGSSFAEAAIILDFQAGWLRYFVNEGTVRFAALVKHDDPGVVESAQRQVFRFFNVQGVAEIAPRFRYRS